MKKNTLIEQLTWDEDSFFSGFGARGLWTVGIGACYLERERSAEGDVTMVIYHRDAMRRAFKRSCAAGGGARGLCSAHLRDNEYRKVPTGATVAEALAIARGLR